MKLLSPLGILYGRAMDVRNALYDRGVLKSHSLGAKTISVGNLTTGGTGKTPLVALIAKILAENGERVCILTRGYGRKNSRDRVLVSDGDTVLADAETGGDEPVELAGKLIGKAIVIADADRVSAAAWAKEKFDVTAFILDDGFQHRRAKRDLDMVCIDATSPCGNARILPAGTLRESFEGLKRADAVVITRADLIGDTTALEARLRNRNSDATLFESSMEIKSLSVLDGSSAEEQIRRLFAFCGIGNADGFFRMLERSGYKLTGRKAFRDHHSYVQKDVSNIEESAMESGADALVTTAKDAVKLKSLRFSLPCHIAAAEIVIDDQAAFRDLLLSA